MSAELLGHVMSAATFKGATGRLDPNLALQVAETADEEIFGLFDRCRQAGVSQAVIKSFIDDWTSRRDTVLGIAHLAANSEPSQH